jgi:hypothetical protein
MARCDLDVRFGSKADVTLLDFDVRFTPESGHCTGDSWISVIGNKQTFTAAPERSRKVCDWSSIAYDRPLSPQREKEVSSNPVAALPSGEASQSFNS